MNVQRYEGEFSWYQLLSWKFVLELRQVLGTVDVMNGTLEVPDYERFRLGGNRRYGLRDCCDLGASEKSPTMTLYLLRVFGDL